MWTAVLAAGCGGGDVASRAAVVRAAAAIRPALKQVRSFEYAIGNNCDTPGFLAAIGASPVDMVITGGGSYDSPLNRAIADPGDNKLIFGYLDVSEAGAYMYPEFFSQGSLPAWFGKEHTGFPGLYTVQYWQPQWEQALLSRIDTIIARGYDGVFLDVLDGNNFWSQGNSLGNTAYPDALPALTTLLSHIHAHVQAKQLARPFYLLGNNPTGIALSDPQALQHLDGIFNEWVYWGQTAADGRVAEYKGTSIASWIAATVAPVYNASGLPVFGNDYPPLDQGGQILASIEFFSGLGWVPSVNSPGDTKQVLSTGPFVFSVAPDAPAVSGKSGARNYLVGGSSTSATFTGADLEDTILGGPGHNVISAGAGDDTIYAHPPSAGLKNMLVVTLSATNRNATTPSATIRVNGQVAVGATPITAAFGTSVQTFTIDAHAYSPVTSLEIAVSGTSYVDAQTFSNVSIEGLSYNGQSIPLAIGSYPAGGASPGFYYTNNGTVSFPVLAFSNVMPFLADTSDVIDGGSGSNTVVYRGNSREYQIERQSDGWWRVAALRTAEGPDLLTNVDQLVFADGVLELASGPAISDSTVFGFAADRFPSLFSGTAITGQYGQYAYAYFPQTGNYVGLDRSGGVWVLGPYTQGNVTYVGPLTNFSGAIIAWQSARAAATATVAPRR